MLASVEDRYGSADVLIDAVIVWENLFGASTETSLRVTSALAWLLGHSAEDRNIRFKLYKEIYTFRSRAVHGDPGVDSKKASRLAPQAVQTSISALRVLFKERPDLLKIKTSEERTIEMVLGGDRAE